jgi:RecB family exonuclease
MTLYSPSRLSAYEACPFRYRLRYLDRVKADVREGIEAFMGLRVHEALERLYRDLRYSRLPSLDELLSFYGGQWDRNWNDSIVITKKGLEPQNYKDTGARCIGGYYGRCSPFDRAVTVGIEEPVSFSLSGDGAHRIRGYIDRLDRTPDGVYEIHDYKTSGALPSQADLDNDRQLAFYEIGIRERFRDANEVRLVWHYLLFDAEFVSVRTHERLDDLKRETVALIETIERDTAFRHKESALCAWCEYAAHCPARRHHAKVASLKPEEYAVDEGVSLVDGYAAAWRKSKDLDAEKERLRAALAEYAATNGVENIAGSGVGVRVSFRDRPSLPDDGTTERRALEDALMAAGLWREVSRLDVKALMDVMESGGLDTALAERIRGLLRVERRARVGPPRSTGDGD